MISSRRFVVEPLRANSALDSDTVRSPTLGVKEGAAVSYDLMVFALEVAPRDRASFMEWYDAQTEWQEDHSYNDPTVCTPALRAWFMEMIQSYPAMNGPYAQEDLPEDEGSVTDYSVGRFAIYAAFSWSKADEAYEHTFRLAAKHGVGFFNASSDKSEVWLPDGKSHLVLAHANDA